MSDIHRYLTEEIALDCRDGLIDRREALRRLGLLGLGAASASALLVGCKEDKPAAPAAPSASAPPAPSAPTKPMAPAPAITFAGPEGR
ncbi:MAG TPA: hypothetical protein VFS00_07985, partial [Polyangiaceae bacterium]|nr:hypothetical protein [Polyangiaceae bacterium]